MDCVSEFVYENVVLVVVRVLSIAQEVVFQYTAGVPTHAGQGIELPAIKCTRHLTGTTTVIYEKWCRMSLKASMITIILISYFTENRMCSLGMMYASFKSTNFQQYSVHGTLHVLILMMMLTGNAHSFIFSNLHGTSQMLY